MVGARVMKQPAPKTTVTQKNRRGARTRGSSPGRELSATDPRTGERTARGMARQAALRGDEAASAQDKVRLALAA